MRAERLIALIMLLERRRDSTARELARELGVSSRTVYRDLETLSGMGVPVYTDVGRGGGIRMLPGYQARLGGLTDADAESMALLASPSGTGELLLDKLAQQLPRAQSLAIRRARERLLFDSEPWFASGLLPDGLDILKGAVWRNQSLQILYERLDGKARQYTIEPYAAAAKVELWYLIAKTPSGMRVFRVSRVLHIEALDQTFVRDEDFDLREFWNAWTVRFQANTPDRLEVHVVISAAGARQLIAAEGRRVGRFLDDVHFDADGLAHAVLDLETEARAVSVLFALGEEVRVEAPLALRGRLTELARTVLEIYA